MRLSLKFAVIPLIALACKTDCVPTGLLCALQIALTVTVTSSTSGAPVTGAFVQIQSPQSTTPIPCNQAPGTTCEIRGYAGAYVMVIGAPAFQSAQRTQVVGGNNPSCGCPTVDARHIEVALVPEP